MKRNIMTKILTLIVLVIFGICLAVGTRYLPRIGDEQSPANQHVSNYYIEHSKEDTEANNIVSGTLADYRGFDTMFETSVMFVSGVVVVALLYRNKKNSNHKKENKKEDAK